MRSTPEILKGSVLRLIRFVANLGNFLTINISLIYFLRLEKKLHLPLKIYYVTIRPLNWTNFSD
jgi:hypothetical protein